MIKKSQKNKIVKAFGKNYSNSLISILTKSKIFNKKGEPFSQDSIRRFVNGDRENERLEKRILKAADTKLAKK